MTDVELAALTALVAAQTARLNHDTAKYGEEQTAPDYRAQAALADVLEQRGLLPPRDERTTLPAPGGEGGPF